MLNFPSLFTETRIQLLNFFFTLIFFLIFSIVLILKLTEMFSKILLCGYSIFYEVTDVAPGKQMSRNYTYIIQIVKSIYK